MKNCTAGNAAIMRPAGEAGMWAGTPTGPCSAPVLAWVLGVAGGRLAKEKRHNKHNTTKKTHAREHAGAGACAWSKAALAITLCTISWRRWHFSEHSILSFRKPPIRGSVTNFVVYFGDPSHRSVGLKWARRAGGSEAVAKS